MKIISIIWFLSVIALLVADVRTGASQDKDKEPLNCYTCATVDNTTDCSTLVNQSQVRCTPEQPYCGTTAKSPDYISTLACIAGRESPCTLIQITQDTYEMTCTCNGHLCNKPFTPEFRDELLNFSPANLPDNTTGGLLEVFINSSVYVNITEANLYGAITSTTTKLTSAPPPQISSSTAMSNTLSELSNAEIAPRAEALKHEATAPSDDDEDDGEGSGSLEDAKPSPAAPAAPSSFLPENQNAGTRVHISLLATISFTSLYIA